MAYALVTGASSGLGAEFAWQLARNGHDVVLVARDRDRLSAVADELRGPTGTSPEILAADLSTRDGQDAVIARLEDTSRPVGLLVNNAGYALGQRFGDSDLDAETAMLEVMVTAVMRLSHAATRAMVARGKGAVLNVSSIASATTSGTYSAHKAWVVSFTEGLARDLRDSPVTATVVRPGLVHTEFHERAHVDYSGLPEFAWIPAAEVVEAALDGVRKGKVIVTPSLRYTAAAGVLKLAPRSMVRRFRF